MAGPGRKLIVHFMRHAAALHKVCDETDITIRDPGLSLKGEQQCDDFRLAFGGQTKHINYVLASPMTRVLQTACYAFTEAIRPTHGGRGIPVIAMPQLQNLDAGPNGTGPDRDELENRYNGTNLDKGKFGLLPGWVETDLVPEGWNLKEKGRWSADNLQWRLDTIRGFLQAIWVDTDFRKHKVEIVIVTHGSILRKLVKDVRFADAKLTHCVFNNADGEFEEISQAHLDLLRAMELEDVQTELDDDTLSERD